MDIDGDLDAGLLQQFSCLGTTDRDVLISQFQKLLGNQLNTAGCHFFLDMNNWNLQAAVCAYFDFDSSNYNVPRMSFVRDVTIGEGEAVPPNMKFVKTWQIQNPSDDRWPPGCCLRFTAGDRMGHVDRVLVDALEPHEMTDVSVEMISPCASGMYQGQWRMSTATGQFFGEVIWVIVSVAEGGLLSLTQQMDAFHQLGSPPKSSNMPTNPFASSSCKIDGSSSDTVSSVHSQEGISWSHEAVHSHVAPMCEENSLPQAECSCEMPDKQNLDQCSLKPQFLLSPNVTEILLKNESSCEEMIP
ncbi:LOW QUALITY PROTEIN: protein ILRUN-like [Uloborus diversus]|uniref:protein ILRUN-like n=1 Tax=Uloborus diversus TaxID=327109 RepID=UPI002409ADD8|nr:protein ILRUN-like [Uloborus diversus]XP_054717606.1 LOW QUALITY PROTEIN: protein ILRUN-like [Uloborus diversus]